MKGKGMKKAALCVILCFLMIGCGKEEVKKKEKKKAVKPYTIDFPASWKVGPDTAAGKEIVGYPVPKQRMPNVNVRKLFFSEKKGFQWFVEDHIGYHTKELKATILEKANDTIGGLPAARVAASFYGGNANVVNIVFIVDSGKKGYAISCEMFEQDYQKYAEELVNAARTFKVAGSGGEEEE